MNTIYKHIKKELSFEKIYNLYNVNHRWYGVNLDNFMPGFGNQDSDADSAETFIAAFDHILELTNMETIDDFNVTFSLELFNFQDFLIFFENLKLADNSILSKICLEISYEGGNFEDMMIDHLIELKQMGFNLSLNLLDKMNGVRILSKLDISFFDYVIISAPLYRESGVYRLLADKVLKQARTFGTEIIAKDIRTYLDFNAAINITSELFHGAYLHPNLFPNTQKMNLTA